MECSVQLFQDGAKIYETPFVELREDEFINHFHLSKDVVLYIVDKIRTKILSITDRFVH